MLIHFHRLNFYSFKKITVNKLGMMGYTCNPRTQEAEPGG
jgi:hypothetical protein